VQLLQKAKASFELICHRYERKSLLVTSNQPFRECHEQRHHRCSPAEARLTGLVTIQIPTEIPGIRSHRKNCVHRST
jgi:DNA replication protein DnaC